MMSEQEKKKQDKPSVMLSAGGTGGHLFPAFALSQELMRRGYEVDLITDMRGDRYGSNFPARHVYQVPAATLKDRSPLAISLTATTLGKGTLKAWRILSRVKPSAVVGFGGYPTFPPVLAARKCGIPTLLHEQNAVMGRANRMLAKLATAIATSFEQVKYLPPELEKKTHFVGNPVRDIVLKLAATPYMPSRGDDPFRLLVFGGSQGARFFSDTVPAAVNLLPDELKNRLDITQQCREEDINRVDKAYKMAGITFKLDSFFAKLPEVIADSHLVVGRAGASTISELTVLGRPSLLVPLPHALDNDQLLNAEQLSRSGGAWCVEQKNLDAETLADKLAGLMGDDMQLAEAAEAASKLGKPDAAVTLADVVQDIAVEAPIPGSLSEPPEFDPNESEPD